MGTVVQTAEETDRMMANTDPRYVFLCYDTGHFTFAGEDPLAMQKKYTDRIGHVHLKDMRLPVVEEARKNHWSFLQSVRNGSSWALENQTYLFMNGWFHYAKLYAALAGAIGFMMIKYRWGIGKKELFQ